MRFLWIILPILLAGCSLADRDARWAAEDDKKCLSFGAKPGTEAYINCRVQMGNQRAIIAGAIVGGGPSTCVRSGAVTNCF